MDKERKPLVIEAQGTFNAGGRVVKGKGTFDPMNPESPYIVPEDPFSYPDNGQSLHGDNAHVFYQIPQDRKKYPIVMLHGGFQTMKCWQTTTDGREGFQNIFLRKNYPVYLVDQPRRGGAGRSTQAAIVPQVLEDEVQFNIFRLGLWPNYYEGTQFPKDCPEALDNFYYLITNNHGDYDIELNAEALADVFNKVGESIYFTHSQSGGIGWLTATKTDNIKAIVSFEPGSCFLFPEEEAPETLCSEIKWSTLPPATTSMENFLKLTKMPIIIIYGDNIAKEPCKEIGRDHWRIRVEMAKKFVDCVNRHGGQAELVCLPDIGIYGNTHNIFSDLNNVEIADLVEEWINKQGLGE